VHADDRNSKLFLGGGESTPGANRPRKGSFRNQG
jgi:hypothetical protein